MTSRHSSETTSSSAPKTSCLTRDLLEDGLDHEVAAAERRGVGDAGDDRAEEARLAFGQPPSRRLLLEIGANRRDRFLDAGRVDVGDHERHLEPAQEQRRELRRHQPRADDADLLDPPRLRVGNPDAPLDPPLDEVERVDARPAPAGRAAGRRAPPPPPRSPPRSSSRRCRRSARARGTGRARRRGPRRRRRTAPSRRPRLRRRGRRLPRGARPSSIARTSHSIESSRNSTSSRSSSASPSSAAWAARRRRFCFSGFATISSTAAAAPTTPRERAGCRPSRDDPEEDLREADVAHRARERAEVAVERDLEAAAEGGAVDRGKRRVGEVANRPERVVPRLRGGARRARVSTSRELGQVGAGGEDERLAGEDEPAPASVAQPRHELAERLERGAAEDVRLLPVLAVVHRHERERPDAGRDLLEEELGRARQACRVFSHSNAAPIPRPMQRAVSP